MNGLNWSGFCSAVRFLTILPFGRCHSFDARSALVYFPVCGLLIGAVLAAINAVISLWWPDSIAALAVVLALVVLTGGLHLDGLADTADGLYGHRSPEQALAIMKDSRIGAMGTIAIVCCLSAKWAGASSLTTDQQVWLILIPAYARSSVLFGVKYLPYGRPDGGTGHAFCQTPLRFKDFWSFGILVGLSTLTGWGFISLNLGYATIVFLAIRWYQKKIQCITGDMMGAMIEITEAGLFLMAACQWMPQ